jgi:hypothetical protein
MNMAVSALTGTAIVTSAPAMDTVIERDPDDPIFGLIKRHRDALSKPTVKPVSITASYETTTGRNVTPMASISAKSRKPNSLQQQAERNRILSSHPEEQ